MYRNTKENLTCSHRIRKQIIQYYGKLSLYLLRCSRTFESTVYVIKIYRFSNKIVHAVPIHYITNSQVLVVYKYDDVIVLN